MMEVFNVTMMPDNVTSSAGGRSYEDVAYCLAASFYIHTVLTAITSIIGLAGNTLSLIVMSKDTQSPVATFLLQAMCHIDNGFLVLYLMNFSLRYAFKFWQVENDLHYSWKYVRIITYPVLFMTQTSTIWITVLIAVTRYISICIPYRASSWVTLTKAKWSVAGVLLFSVAYNMPRFFEIAVTRNVTSTGEMTHKLAYTWLVSDWHYKQIYFNTLYYIVSFIVPLLLLSVLNTRLTLAYRKIQENRARMNLRTEQENNITLVMIIVVLVFILCQAPARVVQLVWGYSYGSCNNPSFFVIELSKYLELVNSSVNFFIYCAFRQQFRTSLSRMFCGPYSPVPGRNGSLITRNGTTKSTNETAC